jgi:hypothetical protein
MALERSHGKVRPTLPRASDLTPSEAAEKPTAQRDEHGHFAAGNRTGVGARFANQLKRAMGSAAAGGEVAIVARDARRVFANILPTLPSDAAPVRALLAIHSRHVALHAFFTARAEAAGLQTDAGLKLLEVADRQSQRAERVLVTVHDLARVHAETSRGRRGTGLPPGFEYADEGGQP